MGQRFDVVERCVPACLLDTYAFSLLQATDESKADAHVGVSTIIRFQRAVPIALRDIYGPKHNAVTAGVRDQLRRRVEAHRLAVEKACDECRMVMTAKPGRGVCQ